MTLNVVKKCHEHELEPTRNIYKCQKLRAEVGELAAFSMQELENFMNLGHGSMHKNHYIFKGNLRRFCSFFEVQKLVANSSAWLIAARSLDTKRNYHFLLES